MRNELFIFGRFTNDSQRVLAAVYRFADVVSELLANFLYGIAGELAVRLELSITAFAHAEGRVAVISHDTQLSLWHGSSLAQWEGRL